MSTSSIFAIAGMTLLAILGLFVASRAVDDGMQLFGFTLVAFGVFLIFWLINRHFDQLPVARADAD